MKVFFKNTGLEFVRNSIVSLELSIDTNNYWNVYSNPIGEVASTIYDCLNKTINVVPSTDITVKIGVTTSNITSCALVELDSNGAYISDHNFTKADLFTESGATRTLSATTSKILLNIKKTDGTTIDYTGSWIKGNDLSYDE